MAVLKRAPADEQMAADQLARILAGTLRRPMIGDWVWAYACNKPGVIQLGRVAFLYSLSLDVEVEDPGSPGQGGFMLATCSSGTCSACGFYYDNDKNPQVPYVPIPKWYQPGPPTVPVPGPMPVPPGPPPTVATAQAIVKSVWGATSPGSMFGINRQPVTSAPIMCIGKHCPDPHAPYADGPNQPDGTFRCYSCRQGIMR